MNSVERGPDTMQCHVLGRPCARKSCNSRQRCKLSPTQPAAIRAAALEEAAKALPRKIKSGPDGAGGEYGHGYGDAYVDGWNEAGDAIRALASAPAPQESGTR